jgi:dihydropteroate synthase
MSKSNFKMMGVINITPDSFSDGGRNFAPECILENCNKMAKIGVDCFDFGAESTAPFNQKIKIEDELKRFKGNLFPVLGEILGLKKSISIDTYKTDVFKELAGEVYKLDPSADLIWNDVSGNIDSKAIYVLKEFPNCTYVLSHNLAPTRALTNSHIEYQEDKLCIEEFFKKGLSKLSFHEKVLLDPCFGFSKSFDQNWQIINDLPKIFKNFDNGLVLGLSKKSFLKSVCKKLGPTGLSYLEILHLGILLNWQENMGLNPYYLRVHDVAMGHYLTSGQLNLTLS